MYDPQIGRWISEDPIGFTAGDANLYRYVANNPANLTDPSGLEVAGNAHIYPLYLGGSYDQPVFALTEAEHTAAHDVLRRHELGRRGPDRTFDPSRATWSAFEEPQRRAIIAEAMRAASIPESLIDQHFENIHADSLPGVNRSPGRPSGYRAGQVVSSSTIQQARQAPALNGSGAAPGAALPTMTVNSFAALTVYTTFRDAIAATGHNGMDLEPINAPYYFTASDKSVFIVQEHSWPLSWFCSPRRLYVTGARTGETEPITSAEVTAYREQAESVWGRYIPGGLFSSARFIPGTQRTSVSITNWFGQEVGYVDENGVHEHPVPRGQIWG